MRGPRKSMSRGEWITLETFPYLKKGAVIARRSSNKKKERKWIKIRGKPEVESRETIMSSFKNYFEPDKTITIPLRITATHIYTSIRYHILFHNCNSKSHCIPSDDLFLLWIWVYGRCCDKKQAPCGNQHETGNEGRSAQAKPKTWEVMQYSQMHTSY